MAEDTSGPDPIALLEWYLLTPAILFGGVQRGKRQKREGEKETTD